MTHAWSTIVCKVCGSMFGSVDEVNALNGFGYHFAREHVASGQADVMSVVPATVQSHG